MYNNQSSTTFWERNRILIKGIVVGILVLAMLIPATFVMYIVQERQQRQATVVHEVNSKWAENQTVTGPVLMLPYREQEKTTDGRIIYRTRMAYVLPDELHIAGNMKPTEKKRSIYSVMLYGSNITLTGKFNRLPLDALRIDSPAVVWEDARLVMNISDLRGIEEQVQLNWDGTQKLMDAGVPNNQLFKQGLSAPITAGAGGSHSFAVNISLRGSEYLYFVPVGKTTDADLSANWGAPAFDGQYLPNTSQISGKNFTAHWKILPMSHTYPQFWADNKQELEQSGFGVRLIQPIDGYAKTNRSVKYAILFIALTFTFFFFLEILQKRRVHPLQYILVGLALTIFYTLLLSISEYTGFNIAYLIAATATISLIGMYTWSIFKSVKTAMAFTTSLSGLYGCIFILIQLEDYALLFGSIGLFIIVAIIMYYSRKIDWYGAGRHESTHQENSPMAL